MHRPQRHYSVRYAIQNIPSTKTLREESPGDLKRDHSGIESSHQMLARQRTVRTRFPLWGSNLEQDTSEVLPGVLWFVLGIYIAWFAMFLVSAINNEPITEVGFAHTLVIFRAVVGGVVPILGAYVVGSDKPAGQWYVPLSFALLFLATLSRRDFRFFVIDWMLVTTAIFFVFVSVLIVFSPAARSFYRNVRDNQVA